MEKIINDGFNTFNLHFSQSFSKSLANFANEVALKHSRYIFTWRVGKKKIGYCTYCNEEFQTFNLKHKSKFACPLCKSLCGVRTAGLSRKYMEDKAALVWYERSKVNPKAITARVIKLYRDYSVDFKTVTTTYNCCHMYLFEPGNSEYYTLGWGDKWEKKKTITSSFNNHLSGNSYFGVGWNKFMSLSNIKRAVKGTPFQYSTWEQYTKYTNPRYVSDMTEFFDLAARYPCIEYLTKIGFHEAIWAKLYRESTYGAIHWNGKTLQKVLRLNKLELIELKNIGLPFKLKHLRYYQKAKKSGQHINMEDAYIMADIDSEHSIYKGYYDEVVKRSSPEVVLKYMKKQIRNGHFKSCPSLLSDWHDYQKQCKTLGMDLKEDRYLFPNNLHEAHMKATEKIKLKTDKKTDIKIGARLKDLEVFSFQYRGFSLRPAASTIELFEEGKALGHCVGGYSKDHASGKANIFFIRAVDQPDTPLYTMDLRIDRIGHGTIYKIMQCRGKGNCEMTPVVKAFVDAFQKKILKPMATHEMKVKIINSVEVAI